jgi:hypothetical protein
MPRPVKPTRVLLPAFLALAIVLAACDGGGQPSNAATKTTSAVIPTPAQTFTGAPGTATYEYANEGLLVTVKLDGSDGKMDVKNDSDNDLDAPGLYVLDAADGHEVDGTVLDAAPVAAGDTASFDVRLDDLSVDDIGLLVLLFGADNYGAFVRTA